MTYKNIKKILDLLPSKSSAAFREFTKSYLEKIADEDAGTLESKALLSIIQNQWDMLTRKKQGKASVCVYTPSIAKNGYEAGHTSIDIVSDDMPFLIDSVVAEIVRQGYLIQTLMHPILDVTSGAAKTAKTKPYSVSHIDLRGTISEEQAKALATGLDAVIDDVKSATGDWEDIKEKLKETKQQLSNAPRKYDPALIEEYKAFLDYMYDNNFTLLGYREYKFTQKDGKTKSETVKGKGLGLLRDESRFVYLNDIRPGLTEGQQKLRQMQAPLTISKVNQRSTVHRSVPFDAVAVKTFDKNGVVTGEILIIGLFTSVTYSRSVSDIPYVRTKVQGIMDKAGFTAGSHDRRTLRHILEKYPRDEVLQISEDLLFDHVTSILRLQERPRIALYMRTDPFGRYISCVVYVPRDRYETRLRLKLQTVLEQELGGPCVNYLTTQDDSPLARVIYFIDTNHLANVPKYDAARIEAKLEYEGRLWSEQLRDAMETNNQDKKTIGQIVHKYGQAFPVSYHEEYEARQALHDIRKLEDVLATGKIRLDLYRPYNCEQSRIRLKVYNPDKPVTLSDVLPIMEKMGFRVIAELPFEIEPNETAQKIWIHDFLMERQSHADMPDISKLKDVFEEAFTKIWYGQMENDGLNKLVLRAQMNWRDITVLRTYLRYLRQVGLHYSRELIEGTLSDNPAIATAIVSLFTAQFNPDLKGRNETAATKYQAQIDDLMQKVTSLEQDKILRSVTAVVRATLRTNFYQMDENGNPKSYISIKLDSRKIADLPEPKPFREIFIYSTRVEGVHLRMDKISRGGIRWSDRHEDFRTEVLGLMKAQQVKNSVIVPMGAKGGFVVKQPPKEGGRPAFQAEGIECYKIFIRGLLDITDNQKGDKVIPPQNVVRRDEDDPYLVVAADKGTATFSDIANAISLEYGHWLGDAFASGGSAGYDHKKMGITARGAWESVKRHFRELNHDTQTQEFDVAGVGDMGGDVFGNGMLMSPCIRLVAAFNHLHIFCDPEPDVKTTFKERARLFNEVKGWDEYNEKLLSKGGRIYNRSEKSLKLTPEIMKRFDITADAVSPNELIQAILKARVDLLFVGGIGTYIKGENETHAEVGDKSNDVLRIDGKDLRAKVMGEGANLAITQKGRIEYAQNGGRLNADFIDNSGGVDCSDHEVNIKILMNAIMTNKANAMDVKKRDKLLAAMTDDVAGLVLRNNYQQSQAISLMQLQAADMVSAHAKLISLLERKTGLNRALENLPSEEAMEARRKMGHGLTRPELATLQAHAKIAFTWDLLGSDITESKAMEGRLLRYFPKKLSDSYQKEILSHRLKREIICTTLATSFINRLGPTFAQECREKTSAKTSDIAKAYVIVRESFDLRDLWTSIETLDNKIPAMVQLKSFREISHMLERTMMWFLSRQGQTPDINKDIDAYQKGVRMLKDRYEDILTPGILGLVRQNINLFKTEGLPEKIARDIALMPVLGSACDIIRIASAQKADLVQIAKIYFEVGEFFNLDWMRIQASYIPANDPWTIEALDGVIDGLYKAQSGLSVRVLKDMASAHKKSKPSSKTVKAEPIVAQWVEGPGANVHAVTPVLAELRKAGSLDLPMLIIAEQKLRNLYAD